MANISGAELDTFFQQIAAQLMQTHGLHLYQSKGKMFSGWDLVFVKTINQKTYSKHMKLTAVSIAQAKNPGGFLASMIDNAIKEFFKEFPEANSAPMPSQVGQPLGGGFSAAQSTGNIKYTTTYTTTTTDAEPSLAYEKKSEKDLTMDDLYPKDGQSAVCAQTNKPWLTVKEGISYAKGWPWNKEKEKAEDAADKLQEAANKQAAAEAKKMKSIGKVVNEQVAGAVATMKGLIDPTATFSYKAINEKYENEALTLNKLKAGMAAALDAKAYVEDGMYGTWLAMERSDEAMWKGSKK